MNSTKCLHKILNKSFLLQEYGQLQKSSRQIGKDVGCSHELVLYYLKKHGISRRNNRKDAVGRKVGMLTITSVSNGVCSCLCDCGKTKSIPLKSLSGTIKSCGCLKKSLHGQNSPFWKGCEGISGNFWDSIKRKSVRNSRILDFTIDIEYIARIFHQQNGKCSLSGVDLVLPGSKEKTCKSYKIGTASLDRKDSSKGYIPGNVHWVHKDFNLMKMDLSVEDFIHFCTLCVNPVLIENEVVDCCFHCERRYKLDGRYKRNQGYGCILGKTWYGIKRDADRRNILFNIGIKDAWNVFVKQRGLCAIGCLPIAFQKTWDDYRGRTASLDRIDSKGPYSVDNIQWVHKTINMMKSNFSQNHFLERCRQVDCFQQKI